MVINLLPLTARNQARLDYGYRLVALAALLLAIVFAAGTLIEITRGVEAQVQTSGWIEQQAQVVDESELLLRQEAVQVVAETNRRLAVLRPLVNPGPTPSEIIGLVLRGRPVGIKIQSIGYEPTADGAKVSLTGVAARRSQLIAWQEELEQLSWVSQVSSPLSNLVKGEEAAFSLEIIFKFASDN